MDYFKKTPLFLLVLFSLWYAGLFGYFNQDVVSIEIPYIGTFRIALAIIILASFVSGAIFASIFFAYDSLRKSFQLRNNKKTISHLKSSMDSHHSLSSSLSEDHEQSGKLESET